MMRFWIRAGCVVLFTATLTSTDSRAGDQVALIPPEPISIMPPAPVPVVVPAAPAVVLAPAVYGGVPVWGAPAPAFYGPTPPPVGYSVPVAVASPIPGLLQYGYAGYPLAPGYPFRKLRIEYEWKRNGMYEVEYKFR